MVNGVVKNVCKNHKENDKMGYTLIDNEFDGLAISHSFLFDKKNLHERKRGKIKRNYYFLHERKGENKQK